MTTSPTAPIRAEMPKGTTEILDRRTLQHSYRSLPGLIQPGMHILDVGCGTGAITRGMAERAGDSGKVIGIDSSDYLIDHAREKYRDVPNLEFVLEDINSYKPAQPFDLITSARTLQWLSNPFEVLQLMTSHLKESGCLSVLDYNHEKIEWTPAPPASMQTLYHAFLQWRADSGMQNDIADRLEGYFQTLGLNEIQVSDQSEKTSRNEAGFTEQITIWTKVAETRGKQLVGDGYITEAQRLQAIEEYTRWIAEEAQSIEMYLLAVEGRR